MAFIFPGFGSAISGMILDETISLGAENIIVFGSCGSLLPAQKTPEILLASSAICDEGTSLHYTSAKHSHIKASNDLLIKIHKVLQQKDIHFQDGVFWTTDAPYRATSDRICKMKKKGCIGVDMEISALYSIASFYHIKIAGFFISKDILTEKQWILNPSLTQKKPSELLYIALDSLS